MRYKNLVQWLCCLAVSNCFVFGSAASAASFQCPESIDLAVPEVVGKYKGWDVLTDDENNQRVLEDIYFSTPHGFVPVARDESKQKEWDFTPKEEATVVCCYSTTAAGCEIELVKPLPKNIKTCSVKYHQAGIYQKIYEEDMRVPLDGIISCE